MGKSCQTFSVYYFCAKKCGRESTARLFSGNGWFVEDVWSSDSNHSHNEIQRCSAKKNNQITLVIKDQIFDIGHRI